LPGQDQIEVTEDSLSPELLDQPVVNPVRYVLAENPVPYGLADVATVADEDSHKSPLARGKERVHQRLDVFRG